MINHTIIMVNIKSIKNLNESRKHFLIFLFGLLVSIIATVGSLYYSEIVGFRPCRLCWFQRIFTYPQVIIYLLGLYMTQREHFNPMTTYTYSIIFSIIAVFIATYHSYIQLNSSELVCSAGCSVVLHRSFGIFSIPNQSLIANILILITCVCGIFITMKN